jgi:hypothetical protein
MSEYVDIMLLGVIGVDFNAINQLLIINSDNLLDKRNAITKIQTLF